MPFFSISVITGVFWDIKTFNFVVVVKDRFFLLHFLCFDSSCLYAFRDYYICDFFFLIHIFLWKDWRKTVDATLKKSVVHFSLIFWLSRFHLSQLIQFIGCDVCIHYHEGKKEKERMSEVVHMSSAFM